MTAGIVLATMSLVSVFMIVLSRHTASKGTGHAKRVLSLLPVAMIGLNLIFTAAAFAMPGDQGNIHGDGDRKKIEQFRKEVEPLKNRLHALREEAEKLVESDNPNWDRILANEIEIAKIRVAMQQIAKKYGLPVSPRKMRETGETLMQGRRGDMHQRMNSQQPQ